MKRFVRLWWPIPAMLAPIIIAQRIWFRRYHPTGHAAGHLGSATAIFAIAFVVATLVWASSPPLRRRPELWVLAAAVIVSALIPTIGNLRVVNAIGTDDWTDDQAGTLGSLRPGFESGHDLAERGMWIVVGFAVLLAGWLWLKHGVGNRVGIAAIILCLIFPPWIFPGAGLIVLAIAAIIERAAGNRQTETREPGPIRKWLA